MPSEKPRYKAAWLKRIHEYPQRHCEVCGTVLLPRIFKNHQTGKEALESPTKYAERRFCSRACRNKGLGNPFNTGRKTKKSQPAEIPKRPAPAKPRRVQREITLPVETKGAVRRALALDLLDPGDFLPADTLDAIHSLQEQGRRA